MSRPKVLQRGGNDLQLLAVREVLRATASALPLEDILAVVANMAIIVFDATTSWVMLAEEGCLRTVAARGALAQAIARRRCATPAPEDLLAHGPMTLLPGAFDPAHPIAGPLATCEQAVVLLPLQAGDRVLGLMGAAVPPEATRDVAFLLTIANQAAAAIETAHLRAETRTWRERLDAIFEHMSEVVVVYDAEGRVALMNPAAEALMPAGSVPPGTPVAGVLQSMALTDPVGRPLTPQHAAVGRALRGERVDNMEVVQPGESGSARHLLLSAVPLGDNQTPGGVLVVGRDVTFIKELERMRAEFLSMVSHELRTPITAVLGFAQLLLRRVRRGETPKDLDKRLATIAEQAKRLNALVEDLLDVSRADARRFALSLAPTDLLALLEQTVQEVSTLSATHRFQMRVLDDVPPAEVDPGRIGQVLRNLLDNACKYAPAGTDVTLQLARQDGHVIISVSDQGPGIDPRDIETLFVPFHRLRQAVKQGVPGVGLGLYISRSIIQAHHGEMWVQSRPGRGSTFHFSLPLGQQKRLAKP